MALQGVEFRMPGPTIIISKHSLFDGAPREDRSAEAA